MYRGNIQGTFKDLKASYAHRDACLQSCLQLCGGVISETQLPTVWGKARLQISIVNPVLSNFGTTATSGSWSIESFLQVKTGFAQFIEGWGTGGLLGEQGKSKQGKQIARNAMECIHSKIMIPIPVSLMPDVWIALNCCGVDGRQANIQWNSTCFPPSPGKQIGMNLLEFIPVRVIGCWSNAPGWVTEFQHPGGYVPYVDPKPEEMQEFVWGCGYCGYCGYLISLSGGQKLCGRLFARCFTPAGKFSGLQTRRKCITYYIYCLIVSTMYHSCTEIYDTVSLSKCSTDKTPQINIHCIYLVEEALRMLSKCFVVNWPIFVDAMVSPCSPKLLRSSKTMQKHPSPHKTSCAQSGVILHIGIGTLGWVPACFSMCILLGFWTVWGDRLWNQWWALEQEPVMPVKELCASWSLTQHFCWLRGNL